MNTSKIHDWYAERNEKGEFIAEWEDDEYVFTLSKGYWLQKSDIYDGESYYITSENNRIQIHYEEDEE